MALDQPSGARAIKPHCLHTSEIAKAANVHPNTVRLYEKWGLLPPIPRTPSGYRCFSEAHRDQMVLARNLLHGPWPGKTIKHSAGELIKHAAGGDLGGALELAYQHLARVHAEQAQAEAAISLLERWAEGTSADATRTSLRIGQAATLLGVSNDMLRNWERNRLLAVPRDPHNRYRTYGATQLGRLRVIRMLMRAGYSTMAVQRMLRHLDQGEVGNLREIIDTPPPDEDIYNAADRWLSTLAEAQQRALDAIQHLEMMIQKAQMA